jgi:hypothetical protein
MIPETAQDELRAMYATALEIPEEMVAPDLDLEAEFGLDSLQHRLVVARAAEQWHVNLEDVESPATLTVRTVTDWLRQLSTSREAV